MSNTPDETMRRLVTYATAEGCRLKHSLGFGKDGSVFATTAGTAVKAFNSRDLYERERDVYQRLAENNVHKVIGHHVPQLVGCSDSLWIIEMTIVQPPYLLDFAGARLDEVPDFSPEVMEQWLEDKREEFGRHWPRVLVMLEVMKESYGIYLLDIHLRNIAFGPEEGESEVGS